MPGLGAVTGPLGSAGSSQAVTPGSGAKSWRVLDQTASNFPMSEFDDNGKLWITADAGDAAQNINLVNRTTTKTASGGTAWFRPQIGFWVKRPGDSAPLMRWQAPALDVTSGVAGSDADPRSDMVLAYRRDLVTPGNSADVIYIVDEAAGRVGVHHNVPRAKWHVAIRGASPFDAGLIVDNYTGADAWLVSYDENGARSGGIFKPTGGNARMRLGGSTTPGFEIDVSGTINTDFLRLANTTGAWQNTTNPRLYATQNPGAGTYPFNASGNLVIQPRCETGTAGQDVVIAVGNTATLTPVITVVGPSNGGPNLNLFGMATNAVGNAKGAVGLANVTTFPTGNPTGGGVMCFTSSAFQFVAPNGERLALGQVNSLPGIGAGPARTIDSRIYRVAAGVWAVGVGTSLTAPTMTGGGLMLENVTTAPSSNPVGGGVLYSEAGALKYRGTAGTVTTIAPA